MRLSTSLLCLCLAAPLPAVAQDTSPAALPLTESIRETSGEALQATLYDLAALRYAAHQAHWNVVGSDFYQLHEFFAELYSELDPYIDQVAERRRVLGMPAGGTPEGIAENASVDGAEPSEIGGAEAIDRLLSHWATVSPLLYDRIEATADDMPTQDLLIAVTALVDKQMWMLRAHDE